MHFKRSHAAKRLVINEDKTTDLINRVIELENHRQKWTEFALKRDAQTAD